MKTLRKILIGFAMTVGVAAGATQAQADFITFFGEDLNNSRSVPLAAFPNASAAQSSFLGNLTGVGTEDFEGFASGTGQPLSLSFPGAGTATLTGGGGRIRSVAPGTTNGFGRYATSGRNYWEVNAGGGNNFTVNMSAPVAAFGFFGIDIGDFGGQLRLGLSNGATTTLDVPNTSGSRGSTDGSVVFFGIVGQLATDVFTSVSFMTTTGAGDVFAFDDFTVGSLEQVNVPEPGSLAIFAIGLAGLGFAGRRRKTA